MIRIPPPSPPPPPLASFFSPGVPEQAIASLSFWAGGVLCYVHATAADYRYIHAFFSFSFHLSFLGGLFFGAFTSLVHSTLVFFSLLALAPLRFCFLLAVWFWQAACHRLRDGFGHGHGHGLDMDMERMAICNGIDGFWAAFAFSFDGGVACAPCATSYPPPILTHTLVLTLLLLLI